MMNRLNNLRNFFSKHKLASILAIGIVFRVILMPITAHPFDVYCWYVNSTAIVRNGPFSVLVFPPLLHYMLIPVAYTHDGLSKVFPPWTGAYQLSSLPTVLNPDTTVNIQFVPGLLFDFVSKIPFLISDILVALLLYKTVEHLTKNNGLAEKAAFLWFLNPFVIWISTGWGMWDTLPALFSLAAFYLLLKKRIGLSAVCLSLGIASKLYPSLFIVPIAIYLIKTSAPERKRKDPLKFFSVLSISSFILFLPYLGEFVSFIHNFGATSAAPVGASGVPISLSYWSLFSLNLLIKNPAISSLANSTFIFSAVLAGVFLVYVYWRTSKLKFQDAASDLAGAMLLSVLALFLSYRLFCEQWLVWLLPLMVVFCVRGQIKSMVYWGASFVALAFVFLNCLLPFFFLPLAPWIGDALAAMATSLISVWSLRIVTLALLGTFFSALLLLLAHAIWRGNKS
jgi:hypothetical protein